MEASLFGQKHSSRDYSQPCYWGKNQFNSSFPASLVAYMGQKGLKAVYLRLNKDYRVEHGEISDRELFGIDPLSEDAYYNYEAGYASYEKFYTGKREKIDLVMIDRKTNETLSSFEVKLTALPDTTTKNLPADHYGTEMVVRPPTICFLACSICSHFQSSEQRDELKNLLGGIPRINHWEEADEVAPHFNEIQNAVKRVCERTLDRQTPLVLQTIWKTLGAKMVLDENCLDVFVWSNLALLSLCFREEPVCREITRLHRTVIWIYKMLFDYAVYGQFDYERIVKLHSYGVMNDKAFSLSGGRTRPVMECRELEIPRIKKDEIKNIILGGGQNYLSPERRFDAVIVNTPNLFDL